MFSPVIFHLFNNTGLFSAYYEYSRYHLNPEMQLFIIFLLNSIYNQLSAARFDGKFHAMLELFSGHV